MTPVGFESAIPVSERPQSHVLDCAGTGIGFIRIIIVIIILLKFIFG